MPTVAGRLSQMKTWCSSTGQVVSQEHGLWQEDQDRLGVRIAQEQEGTAPSVVSRQGWVPAIQQEEFYFLGSGFCAL